MQIESISL
jgi:hypothetical protein